MVGLEKRLTLSTAYFFYISRSVEFTTIFNNDTQGVARVYNVIVTLQFPLIYSHIFCTLVEKYSYTRILGSAVGIFRLIKEHP